MRCERALLERTDGPWAHAVFVDVGFGEHPWTTLEAAAAFREVNPGLAVVGVELEAHRAEAAAGHADARTHFRQGGFALPLRPDEPARLIRAMNLLRGYPPERVPEVHGMLGQSLLPGGLLVEGSTDTEGAVLVAHLLRRTEEEVVREAMLFHTDFHRGFAPILFRDWLPRDLRRSVKPGTPIQAFFDAWTESWTEARAEGHTELRDAFRESVLRLAARDARVSTEPWLADNGYLLLRPLSLWERDGAHRTRAHQPH